MMFGRRKKSTVASGDKAPFFRLNALQGLPQSLDEILGRNPALLVFYKISCPVCQLTAPYLERLAKSNALQVIGISQDDAGGTRGFTERFGVTFPTLLDSSAEGYPASNAYGITSVPSLFLVERNGSIARSFSGFSKRDLEEVASRAGVSIFNADDHVPEWKAG